MKDFSIFVGILTFCFFLSISKAQAQRSNEGIEIYVDGKRFESIEAYKEYRRSDKKEKEAPADQNPITQPAADEIEQMLQSLINQLSGTSSNESGELGLREIMKGYTGGHEKRLFGEKESPALEETKGAIQGLLNSQIEQRDSASKETQQEKLPQIPAEDQMPAEDIEYQKTMRDLRSILEQRVP